MKNKGFTLIELLAVIIILGLIATIIIPKIANTLKEAETKTNLESAKGLVKSAEYKYQENEMNGITENILINYTTGENTSKIEYGYFKRGQI